MIRAPRVWARIWARVPVWVPALGLGLGCGSEPSSDPLDTSEIRELSTAVGSAAGTLYTGDWNFGFTTEACDCPNLDIAGETLILCELAAMPSVDANLAQSSGFLIIDFPAAMQASFTGAIEMDGTFVVAGVHDATTIAGPLEVLGRLDGEFTPDATSGQGWSGQRLIGQLAGQPVDCRWTGTFTTQRY